MGFYGTWTQTWGDPLAARTVVKSKREHKLTPREVFAQQIDAVESGREIVFELGEIYVKPFITILRNPTYPALGKRFVVFQEGRGCDGSPSGKRGKVWDTNHSLDIAKWVLEREGHLYKVPAGGAS
jgi:hypothetical protein